jgi:tryptophan-rich sensory protein
MRFAVMARKFQFRVWHAATFMVGMSALSYMSTRKGARAYWQGLNKTPRTPPAWVFPAVWSGLNVLQLWADLRVLNNPDLPDRNTVLGLRAVNWLLYAMFTPAFFRAKSPISAEMVTLAEGVTAGATVAILARRDPIAAAALTPLTLWTGYAALVGGEIAAKNPDNIVDRLRWDGAF